MWGRKILDIFFFFFLPDRETEAQEDDVTWPRWHAVSRKCRTYTQHSHTGIPSTPMPPRGHCPLLLKAAQFFIFPRSKKTWHTGCTHVPPLPPGLGEHFIIGCILGRWALRGLCFLATTFFRLPWEACPCPRCAQLVSWSSGAAAGDGQMRGKIPANLSTNVRHKLMHIWPGDIIQMINCYRHRPLCS